MGSARQSMPSSNMMMKKKMKPMSSSDMAKMKKQMTTTKNKPKTYKGKSMKPGGGGQFKKGSDALVKKGYSRKSADAIMAVRGRKKYGAKKMAKFAAQGRKRAARKKGK